MAVERLLVMLCKAIIDKVIDPYSARVRIPIYHQIESSPFATKSEDLPIASICSMPGVEMALKAGDVVYVDFELDHREDPVIVGILSRSNSTSSSNIKAQSLQVDINCNLPDEIYLTKEGTNKSVNFDAAIEQMMAYEGGGGGGDFDIGFVFDDGTESMGGDVGFIFG